MALHCCEISAEKKMMKKIYLGEKYGLMKGLYAKYCRFRHWVFRFTFYESGIAANARFRDWMGKINLKQSQKTE